MFSDVVGYNEYNDDNRRDLWDYKTPSRKYWVDDNNVDEINRLYGGNQLRELTGVEWTGSSYFVYFKMGKKIKRVNIIDECRRYCKEHSKRFNQSVRDQLKATMPKELDIWLKLTTFYQRCCPYNEGGFRYVTGVNEQHLRDVWLSKIIF